jgi:hypothetical protein
MIKNIMKHFSYYLDWNYAEMLEELKSKEDIIQS